MAWRTAKPRRSADEKQRAILLLLAQRGTLSLRVIAREIQAQPQNLYSTLWNLVWAGLVVVDDQFEFGLKEK